MAASERLFAQLIRGAGALLIWAVHFFFSYVYVAAGCMGEAPLRRSVLLAGSALALAAVCALLWQAVRRRARGLAGWAQAGGAVLALIGILWSSVPMFMLGLCR